MRQDVEAILRHTLNRVQVVLAVELCNANIIRRLRNITQLTIHITHIARRQTVLRRTFSTSKKISKRHRLRFLTISMLVQIRTSNRQNINTTHNFVLTGRRHTNFHKTRPISIARIITQLMFTRSMRIRVVVRSLTK